MIFASGWYTVLCIALNQTVGGAGGNFMTDAEIAALTPEIAAARSVGAKWAFVGEESRLNLIWLLKACMLITYIRMT